MSMRHLSFLAALFVASFASQSQAGLVQFEFSGPDVSGSVQLTYGAATDSKYPSAFEVTGISGTISDSSLGIVNASITSLVGITHATPEATNLLAPNDFSRFAVASGLMYGTLSYDNLFWPSGSPQTASDYPFGGGFLDIYGLLFNIDGGKTVNLWSNGVLPGNSVADYGLAIVTSAEALHYVAGGVSANVVPEPSSIALLSLGALGLSWNAYRRRRSAV